MKIYLLALRDKPTIAFSSFDAMMGSLQETMKCPVEFSLMDTTEMHKRLQFHRIWCEGSAVGHFRPITFVALSMDLSPLLVRGDEPLDDAPKGGNGG